MKTPTYEAYLQDPAAMIAQVHRQAARERALAVHEYLLRPLMRACGRLVSIRGVGLHLDPRAAATQ